MTWPVPAPGDISSRAAATYEALLPGIDARQPNTVATVNCRITEQSLQDLYLYQGNVAAETMPDTAVQNLPRFGVIYNVPQEPAVAATGELNINGTVGAVVAGPLDFTMSGTDVIWASAAGGTVNSGGELNLILTADIAGVIGNVAPSATLTLTSPAAGLTSLFGVVNLSSGIEGGIDVESTASWRSRILAQIRQEPSGGNYQDYVKWALAAGQGVALAACPAAACGGGVVSVVIAMPGPSAPNSAQIAAVLAYINTQRPVTAAVTVYGVTLNPVNVTLHVSPNTPAIQAAAAAALALSFQQDAAIGGTTYLSRLNNAVSSADGEYYHELTLPAADVPAPTLFALNVLGTVTFT
jgi:uncharacterized phage protein gp47/JayE